MNEFLKVIAGLLASLLLYVQLSKQQKDYAAVFSIAASCFLLFAAIEYLTPVFQFIGELENLAGLDSEMLKILLKAVGIGLLSEIAGLICNDCGNGALGKSVQLFASCVILWLSLPLFTNLLALIKNILVSS